MVRDGEGLRSRALYCQSIWGEKWNGREEGTWETRREEGRRKNIDADVRLSATERPCVRKRWRPFSEQHGEHTFVNVGSRCPMSKATIYYQS